MKKEIDQLAPGNLFLPTRLQHHFTASGGGLLFDVDQLQLLSSKLLFQSLDRKGVDLRLKNFSVGTDGGVGDSGHRKGGLVAGDAMNLFQGGAALDRFQKAVEEHGAEAFFMSYLLQENRVLPLQNHFKEIIVQN